MYKLLIAILLGLTLPAHPTSKARQWYKAKAAKLKAKKKAYQQRLEAKIKKTGRKVSRYLEKGAKELKEDEELRYSLYERIQERGEELDIPKPMRDTAIHISEEQMGFIKNLPFEEQRFIYGAPGRTNLIKNAFMSGEVNEEALTYLLNQIPEKSQHFLTEKYALKLIKEIGQRYNDYEKWGAFILDYAQNNPQSDRILYFSVNALKDGSFIGTTQFFSHHLQYVDDDRVRKLIQQKLSEILYTSYSEDACIYHNYFDTFSGHLAIPTSVKAPLPEPIMKIVIDQISRELNLSLAKPLSHFYSDSSQDGIEDALRDAGLLR